MCVDKKNSYLLLRSKDRISGTPENFTINLNNPISESWVFESIVIKKTFYPIETNYNDTIYFNETSVGDLNCQLSPGEYNITELLSEIGSKMTTASGSSTYTASVNNISNKITITSNTNTFIMKFGTSTTNTSRKILGFNESDSSTASLSQTSDNIYNLNPIDACHIEISNFDHIFETETKSPAYYQLTVPLDANFGDIVNYEHTHGEFHQVITIKSNSTRILKIKVFNNDDYIQSLNGSDWYMILRKL